MKDIISFGQTSKYNYQRIHNNLLWEPINSILREYGIIDNKQSLINYGKEIMNSLSFLKKEIDVTTKKIEELELWDKLEDKELLETQEKNFKGSLDTLQLCVAAYMKLSPAEIVNTQKKFK